MDKRMQDLLHRLTLIGYRSHEIKSIVRSAVGSNADPVGQLERYERLGLHYINNYSQ
jgi:hypothetical protein